MANAALTTADFVERKLRILCASSENSAGKANLAKLRRGIGKAPGSMPELWPTTLEGLPEELMGNGGKPSRAEWAAYTALTLFAMHQQGRNPNSDCMFQAGITLGKALRRLAAAQGGDERVKRRLDAMATSSDMKETANHLRGLVQLMKSEGIALDYSALMQDLYNFQYPDSRDSVRLRWGRDFYRSNSSDSDEATHTTEEKR